MLVHASAQRCWVLASSAAAAPSLSLSARRESDRASRSNAVICFAEAGPGSSISGMAWSLRSRTAPPSRLAMPEITTTQDLTSSS